MVALQQASNTLPCWKCYSATHELTHSSFTLELGVYIDDSEPAPRSNIVCASDWLSQSDYSRPQRVMSSGLGDICAFTLYITGLDIKFTWYIYIYMQVAFYNIIVVLGGGGSGSHK